MTTETKPAVELRQLIGYRMENDEKVRVLHDVDQVLFMGRQIGTMGHSKRSKLCLLAGVSLSLDNEKLVLNEIARQRGRADVGMVAPVPIPEAYEETDDEDDEDDDE